MIVVGSPKGTYVCHSCHVIGKYITIRQDVQFQFLTGSYEESHADYSLMGREVCDS